MSVFSDVVAGVTLAWKLYHECWMVAYDSPDAFRLLVTELSSAQNILTQLRDQINTNASFLEKGGQERKQALLQEAENTKKTLESLGRLMSRFYKLGRKSGVGEFWTRIQWARHQKDIENHQRRLMAHNCLMSLAMTAMGNSTLDKVHEKLNAALASQPPLIPIGGTTIRESRPATPTPQRESSNVTTRGPSHPQETAQSISHGGQKSISTVETEYTGMSLISENTGSSYTTYPDEGEVVDDGSAQCVPLCDDMAHVDLDGLQDGSDVANIVGEAWSSYQGNPNNPVRSKPTPVFDPPHPFCIISEVSAQRFKTAALLQRRESVSIDDWLCAATWWLSKSRTILRLQGLHNQPESLPPSTRELSLGRCSGMSYESEMSLELGFDHLRKASWIVYTVILGNYENLSSKSNDSNLTSLLRLITAIHTDFMNYRRYGFEAGTEDGTNKPTSPTRIWEPLCVVERRTDERQTTIPTINKRWIAVENKYAGEAGEHVLYQSFVNAEIGSRNEQNMSVGAPYMLLIHAKDGESEPKVTLCSQRGFINTSKDITEDDVDGARALLRTLGRMPRRSSHLQRLDPLHIKFEDYEVNVEFLILEELERFVSIPENFFRKIKDRGRRHGENLLYDQVVDTFAVVNPTNFNERQSQSHFCGVKVYERSEPGSGWLRSRRLVVNSSPKEYSPFCHSTFLPMSNVYVNTDRDDRRLVMLKFSNCDHPQQNTRPDLTVRWSRVYDAHNPNVCVSFSFTTTEDAQNFAQAILMFSAEPEWQSEETEGDRQFVYRITAGDADDRPKALQIVRWSEDWTYSNLFFVPKSVDFILSRDADSAQLRFPDILAIDYVSNHVDKLCDCDDGVSAEFARCSRKRVGTEISFSFAAGKRLLHALTSKWEVEECIRVKRAKYDDPKSRRFLATRTIGAGSDAQISVWSKGHRKKLVVKWTSAAAGADAWMTASLSTSRQCLLPPSGKDSDKTIIPDLEIQHGMSVDLGSMTAVSPRNTEAAQRQGVTLMVQFQSFKEKERFAEASGLHIL